MHTQERTTILNICLWFQDAEVMVLFGDIDGGGGGHYIHGAVLMNL
jgi:hypothetical protein